MGDRLCITVLELSQTDDVQYNLVAFTTGYSDSDEHYLNLAPRSADLNAITAVDGDDCTRIGLELKPTHGNLHIRMTGPLIMANHLAVQWTGPGPH